MGEIPSVGRHLGEIRPVSSHLPLCCIPGQGGLLRPLRTLGRVNAHVNMPSQITQVGFLEGNVKKTLDKVNNIVNFAHVRLAIAIVILRGVCYLEK